MDILKEIGNIGSGNAATSLSKMVNKRIDMSVPEVKVLDFKDAVQSIGEEEEPVTGIYMDIFGDIKGSILFILSMDSTDKIIDALFYGKIDKVDISEKMYKSALSELGNIICSSYITAISAFTSLKIKISIPSISFDMAGAILSVPLIKLGAISDKALFIKTDFIEGQRYIQGDFILVPDVNSFENILKALGVNSK